MNRKKCDGADKLQSGDTVQLFLSEETIEGFRKKEEKVYPYRPLEVLYEDEDLLLVNKPAGMLTQKAETDDVSLNEYLIGYLLKEGKLKEEELATFTPSVCNRLDRNTSGIVICGKSMKGLQMASAMLRNRTMEKYYLAVVKGRLTEKNHLKGYLKKDEATNRVTVEKEASPDAVPIETVYLPLASNSRMTLLRVQLITGKSHQIRAHLASIGHPVLGDFKYGDRLSNEACRREYGIRNQLLHAWQIHFPEAEDSALALKGKDVTAPMPREMKKVLLEEGLLKK